MIASEVAEAVRLVRESGLANEANAIFMNIPKKVRLVNADADEIEFPWKERLICWEGSRGVVFSTAGAYPPVTIVPDSVTWDRKAPPWLHGRHDEVVARLRANPDHVVHEERDDSGQVTPLEEVTR